MKKTTPIVIMAGVRLQQDIHFEDAMEELRQLAEACELQVGGSLTQQADKVNTSHYLGSGKLQELKAMREAAGADAVIINDELTPSQLRNLETALGTEVLDRTMLILNIFARRARTREAQLQVETARLRYMLPRLTGMSESLGRQGGGSGLVNRGSGETKLELDRRRVEERIAALQTELDRQVARRQLQRRRRHKNEWPVVCLVGYTNAGKSTLMNAIVEHYHPDPDKKVLAKNMLFATLDTSVRRIDLPDRKSFLLTDTVGFVSRLPHHLVKAFRSTLEEVTEADLLIHVADLSSPHMERQIEVTRQTLKELGADRIPVVYAYNKADLAEVDHPAAAQNSVTLSAFRQQGIGELIGQIRERVFTDYVRCELLIPFDRGDIVSYFNEHADVREVEYEESGTRLKLECRAADYAKYRELLQG